MILGFLCNGTALDAMDFSLGIVVAAAVSQWQFRHV